MQPSLNSYKLASSEIQVKDLKIAPSKQQNYFFPQGNLEVNSNGLTVFIKVRTEALLTFPFHST